MLPGLTSLPSSQLQLLHQAWLSRAPHTPHINSFVQAPLFPFPNPFLGVATSSPADHPLLAAESQRRRAEEEAEDLSFTKRFKGGGGEIICPICSIAVRRDDLVEHFETELRCLDNIRSLSPITTRASPVGPPRGSPAGRPASTSPFNQSSSLSPACSPLGGGGVGGYLETRWQRFERIRCKRRERIGVSSKRRMAGLGRRLAEEADKEDEDIDIGDSLSDGEASGGGSDAEGPSSIAGGSGAGAAVQYTEADVLRCLSGAADEKSAAETSMESETTSTSLLSCPACLRAMSTPVLNTSCWHLKCEQCWLRTVGTTKTCSLCAKPASVKQLRRVQV